MDPATGKPGEALELLSTKLVVPQLRYPLVTRPALLARLEQGIQHNLILLSAPAGYGKTTLVGEWLIVRSMRQPGAAWVSLDRGDNDPVRFWTYVITACRAFGAQTGMAALEQLQACQRPPFEALLNGWINELAQLTGDPLLVLEDYHVVDSPSLQASLSYFIDHLPPQMHLVILTREEPILPLARWRAHGEVFELGPAELRFSLAETQVFLRQALPFPLTEEAITRLAGRLEGWAAGLRLVALALQGRGDLEERDEFLASLPGSHRPILEFLVDDVLSAQTEAVQEFLLATSLLSRLTAALCDAVTGRKDSAAVLIEIERANLFLFPLDGNGEWFRYHALFAEAMQHQARRRLGNDRVRDLYRQASRWYEHEGLLAEAIEASLAAQDFEPAAGLIERIIAPRLVQNEFTTLRRWLELLPDSCLQAHPSLALNLAIATMFTSERRTHALLERVLVCLQWAEAAWEAADDQPQLGEALAFRAILDWGSGDLPQSFTAARKALERLPEAEKQWRGISLIFLGTEALFNGELTSARKILLQAQALSAAAGNIYGVLSTTHLLGDISVGQGDLMGARQLYQKALEKSGEMEHTQFERGCGHLGLAMVALEEYDLIEAQHAAEQGLEIGSRISNGYLQLKAAMILAQVAFARGDIQRAQECLHNLVARSPRGTWPVLVQEVQTYQARLSLAAGDQAAAEAWSADSFQAERPLQAPQEERQALLSARLAIAQDRCSQALELLAGWLVSAQAAGRLHSEIKILILTALAHYKQGEGLPARKVLAAALALAHPGELRGVFLGPEGPPQRLLYGCRTEVAALGQEGLLAYYDRLVTALNEVEHRMGETLRPGAMPGNGQVLITSSAPLTGTAQNAGHRKADPEHSLLPLSLQEERVLGLLVEGFSYQEIAQELVVSVNTVKTHVKGVYRKLNVSRRREARDTVRRFNLL